MDEPAFIIHRYTKHARNMAAMRKIELPEILSIKDMELLEVEKNLYTFGQPGRYGKFNIFVVDLAKSVVVTLYEKNIPKWR